MSTPGEQHEIEQVARAVIAGADAIEIPAELTTERPGAPAESDEAREKSLYAQIQAMTVPQKVKLAIRGNKEARSILIRSTHKLVQRMVLQNPRITEDEVFALAKNRNIDEEILRTIAENRDWTASYQIRSALVENARTPIMLALRLLRTLAEREIRNLAKSKNVPHVIAAQARKILFEKQQAR